MAVRAVFPASDAYEVRHLLNSVESDRVVVAILVEATLGKPDINKIQRGVDQAFVDYRDVLMTDDSAGALKTERI